MWWGGRLALGLAALALTACQGGQTAEEAAAEQTASGPPVLGALQGTLGGAEAAWQTYDFTSLGLAETAWVTPLQGVVRLSITGYPPGEPTAEGGLIRIIADFTEAPVAGLRPGLLRVEILQTPDPRGPRLTSAGSPVELVLDSVAREDAAPRGRIAGRVSAVLCQVAGEGAGPDRSDCRELQLGFDTGLQYSAM